MRITPPEGATKPVLVDATKRSARHRIFDGIVFAGWRVRKPTPHFVYTVELYLSLLLCYNK